MIKTKKLHFCKKTVQNLSSLVASEFNPAQVKGGCSPGPMTIEKTWCVGATCNCPPNPPIDD